MFINDDFLLHNDISKKLYHNISKIQPIIDYHCHLDPKLIAENKEFEDITQIWLLGDHYKWRAMRSNGVDEFYITGSATNKEKFLAWAEVLENCVGNPLYHWSALELKRYFDIDEILTKDNAEKIWDMANKIIKDRKYTPKKIIKMSNVSYICTTDNPIDDLKWHDFIKEDREFNVIVSPGFRPDDAFSIKTDKFYIFLEKLVNVVGFEIENYSDFIKALYERIDYFADKGCKVSDHGLGKIKFLKYSREEVNDIFLKILKREKITCEEEKKYISSLLIDLSKKYTEKNFIMQIHYGAIRNNDEELFIKLGPDIGTDSIMDQGDVAENLNLLLSCMKLNKALPKLIIYNLDPSQNNMLACTLFNFSANSNMKGKLQFGAGWWFNDTKEGMLRQLKTLADHGLIMNFVGMLTDSRSFVSYTRHEYFRRILCQYIGDLVEKGEIPNNDKLLTKLIKNISFDNALKYFSLEGEIK